MPLSAADTRELEALYRQHHQYVFRACLRFAAGDRAWAMDRVHDVFIKAAKAIENGATIEHPKSWLYRTAVNLCVSYTRRRGVWGRVSGLFMSRGPESSQMERSLRLSRDARALQRALDEMKAPERAVLILMYFEDRQQIEIAEILGLSKGQVSKLHKRAIERLRELEWDVDDA